MEQGHCDTVGCFDLRWSKSRYCQKHIFTAGQNLHDYNNDQHFHQSRDEITQGFEKQWTYTYHFQEVENRLALIADGKMPGGMLVDLDIEFSATSGKVFEVGICEHYSGKVLVNARIEHNCSNVELHANSSSSKTFYQGMISRKSALRVYGKDLSQCTGLFDVHALARLFQACGITPRTYFLSWHKNKQDLVLLRRLFENAGYHNILPSSDDYCQQMIPQFRRNIPTAVGGAFNLERLFQLLFRGHELVGQNHRALADAQQLRLMVLLFHELCKPVDQRDPSCLPKTIKDWLQKPSS